MNQIWWIVYQRLIWMLLSLSHQIRARYSLNSYALEVLQALGTTL